MDVPLYINGDSTYHFADQTGVPTEDTSGFAAYGDLVEGRVAGALWDLYDSNNDGKDTRSYSFSLRLCIEVSLF